jgi:hypothetical protein
MARRNKDMPEQVHQAAETTWHKWREKIASEPRPDGSEYAYLAHPLIDPDAGKSHEQLMIEKIKRRMKEYPEWYEADPAKLAATVSAELERIGKELDAKLPYTRDPVEMWEIPLSVFNWLENGETGETFVHGALSAWSSAENFNAANASGLNDDQRAKLRAPFLDLSPMLLTAVLEEMLETDLWITFAEKFVGPELKFLVMRVQRPV